MHQLKMLVAHGAAVKNIFVIPNTREARVRNLTTANGGKSAKGNPNLNM
ncbi:MAG TPA: hypothetical protein VK722_19880 [Candidatus Aquilonibacter sp.]|jgi:hypothetical protein|nr:hypothetical protein [Candidatus Aquilonibacter sp.]